MTWMLRRTGTGLMAQGSVSLDSEPCLTIMAGGLGGGCRAQYWIEDDGQPMTPTKQDKPPYRVPSMAEICAIPPNGLRVVSTFSGCGGSCTGYRMAGYKVVWANEFVPAAQDSYRANMDPSCILDGRDIRTVTADDIMTATGLARGELDLFDGSPPCQAFSTAGKRAKGWGKERHYEHGAHQKNEDLFFEYIRLLDGLQPRAFVAENVSGLVKGVSKGYFLDILKGLKGCGYRVTCRVLDAQWLGVPQARQRAIFVGVRNDLGLDPVHPSPLPYRYSVRDALPELMGVGTVAHGFTAAIRNGVGRYGNEANISNVPAPAVLGGSVGTFLIEGANGFNGHAYQDAETPARAVLAVPHGLTRRKFTIAELRRICAFPDDFVLTGSYAQQWERLGNSVPPVMMYHIAAAIRDRVLLP